MLNRRGLLKLGLGAAVVLGVAGAGLALLQPGLVDGRFGPRARALMRAVALAVLDGSWGADRAAAALAVEAHLDRVERSVAVFPAGVREELSQVLALLGSSGGRLALTGLTSDWAAASTAEVQAALQAMRVSTLATRQQIYFALRDLHCVSFFGDPSSWPLVGYPGPREIA